MPRRKVRPEYRERFTIVLTQHNQDREIAEILDGQANASAFVKSAILWYHKFQNMEIQPVQAAPADVQLGDNFTDEENNALMSMDV